MKLTVAGQTATAALLLVLLAGCASSENPSRPGPTMIPFPSPAGPRSAEPFLVVDEAQRLHMTWIERTSDSLHAVKYARYEGSAWSAPATVVERGDLFVNWADFPAVVSAPGGHLTVHWLQRSGASKYAYDVRVAQSSDSGVTWSTGAVLHHDGKAAEHGFVTWWNGQGDTVHAAWLDGRQMTGGDHGEGGGAMTVHTTAVASDGSIAQESPLDLRTCECCQVNSALAASGPVVVYRDRSDDDIRDIGIVRRVGNAWTAPAIVHHDGWKIAGCPVNGPAVAARGDTVAVAWFTGAQDTARVRLAWSVDGGSTFATPTRVDAGSPVGRVDLELLDGNTAVVTWLERMPPEAGEVRLRRVTRAGEGGTPVVVASTAASRPAGFPKLVRLGFDLIAAWTVPGDTSTIRMGRIAGGVVR